MYDEKDYLPKPLGTIDELMDYEDSSGISYKTFVGSNLGNRTFLMRISMDDFYRISAVANIQNRPDELVTQRRLDLNHAKKLATYILKGLVSSAIKLRVHEKKEIHQEFRDVQNRLGTQPYLSLQPIVVNLRECQKEGKNIPGRRLLTKKDETAAFEITLSQKHKLWVVDGQHRRKAIQIVFEYLDYIVTNKKYPGKKQNLLVGDENVELSSKQINVWEECQRVSGSYCSLLLEVHLGLNAEEERQLFHDLNNLGKKVETSLALQFDNSNPINIFIKEELCKKVLSWEVLEKDIINWDEDKGSISRKDLVAINARLFLNKNNIKGVAPPEVDPKKEIAFQFWKAVKQIPSLGGKGAKIKSIAAQPVLLKSLARLTYDFGFGRNKNSKNLEVLLKGITSIDYSHKNLMWRYYELTDDEKNSDALKGLKEYLPSDDEGYNRDIGKFDPNKGVMRFGAKHNDIYPILGDIIRWKMNLPNRHSSK